ncbi:MAG: AfsR/SARP family transcriptional regulator, partial [Actinomycetota bacterium]
RSALWRLRQVAPWLVAVAEELQVSSDVEIDVREARRVAGQVADPIAANENAELELFITDLLPDWYEDWVIIERERFRQTRLHALEDLCELLASRGRYGRAIDAGLSAVAGEPLRESAHMIVIRAHLAEGNLGEAVRQFRSYSLLLEEELGVEPSEELKRLIGVPIT